MYFKDGGYILGTLRCSLGTERVCKKVITASRKALKTHPSQRQVASLKTPCNGHTGCLLKVLAPPCLRRRLRCRESAAHDLPQLRYASFASVIGCVAGTSWKGRSEVARLNPTLTQVSDLLP